MLAPDGWGEELGAPITSANLLSVLAPDLSPSEQVALPTTSKSRVSPIRRFARSPVRFISAASG